MAVSWYRALEKMINYKVFWVAIDYSFHFDTLDF